MWKIRLDSQLEKIADVISDLGLIAVASVVLPAVLDRFRFFQILAGIAVAALCWVLSLWILKSTGDGHA